MKVRGHDVRVLQDDVVYHGDAITLSGVRNTVEAVAAHAQRFEESIDAGLRFLESDTAGHAHDTRPICGAPVETFQYFSARTGEHLLASRLPRGLTP